MGLEDELVVVVVEAGLEAFELVVLASPEALGRCGGEDGGAGA